MILVHFWQLGPLLGENMNTIVTILGSGFAAYVGVKVAIAEDRVRIKNLESRVEDHNERILFLERKP